MESRVFCIKVQPSKDIPKDKHYDIHLMPVSSAESSSVMCSEMRSKCVELELVEGSITCQIFL